MLISSVSRSYQLVARFSRIIGKANSIAKVERSMAPDLGKLGSNRDWRVTIFRGQSGSRHDYQEHRHAAVGHLSHPRRDRRHFRRKPWRRRHRAADFGPGRGHPDSARAIGATSLLLLLLLWAR